MGSVFPLGWGSIPSSPVDGRSHREPQGLSGCTGYGLLQWSNSAPGQAPSEISSRRSALVFFNVCTNCFCHFMAVRCTFTWHQKL